MVEDCGCSLDEAVELLTPYEVIPYIDPEARPHGDADQAEQGGAFCGVPAVSSQSACHIRPIKEFLQPILDKEKFLVTKVADDEADAFITHLGFEPLGTTMQGFAPSF